MQIDRIVLDSNVIISFLISKKVNILTELKHYYDVEIYTCDKQINELENSFSYPKLRKQLPLYKDYINFFLAHSTLIEIDERFDRSPDLKDNYLFDLAYTAKSNFLITGDKPLLNMKSVNKIQIISYVAYKKLLVSK